MGPAARPSLRFVARTRVRVGLLVLVLLAGLATVTTSGSPPETVDLAAESGTAEPCPAIDDGGGDEAVIAAPAHAQPRDDDRSTVDELGERVLAAMSDPPLLPPPKA